jgi:hypothetical protein
MIASDAQTLAALNAYDDRFATDYIDDYSPEHIADMRRAVTAALSAQQ